MSVRIVLTITAAPGKSEELAKAYQKRCEEVLKEPGCLQFEAFQSVKDPHRFAVHEHWADQAALDVHAALNKTRQSPVRGALAVDSGQREDYIYNRTR
jgi:quinol monooxygenase YgiN